MSIGVFAGVYIWSSYKRPLKIFTVLGIAFLLAALALSQSRSSMIGLIAGFLLVAALSNLFAFMLTAALGSIGTWTILQPGLLDSILGGLASLVSRSGRVAEITSFTGRSEIWAGVFAKWLESPWFGYGLGSPRIIVAEAYRDQWGNTHESAHNWLLESLISFGIAGTTLLVIFLGLMAWRLWTFKQNDSAPKNNESIDWPLVLCMRRCFVFCLISGLMEKAFAGMPNPSLILLTCIAGSCVALTRQGHVASVFAVASPIIFSAHLRPLAIGRNGAAK
jgi:O-antigen ligase